MDQKGVAMPKPLEFYLAGGYSTEIIVEAGPERPIYIARIICMPGCLAQSDDPTDARQKLAQFLSSYIRSRYERGADIPDPDLSEGLDSTTFTTQTGGIATLFVPAIDAGLTVESEDDELRVAAVA